MANKKKVSPEIRKKRRRRRNILIGEIIILIILSVGLFAASKWNLITHDTSVSDAEIYVNPEIMEETPHLTGYKTIALLGVDNRVMGDYNEGNSDTIIIMAINNDTKEIRMMSVYRDTYLQTFYNEETGQGTYQKCNSAYAMEGPWATVEMLNRNIDLNIKDYVSVDFKALADAVDAVGGIDVEIENDEVKEMNKFISETEGWLGRSSSNIAGPGMQHLDGIQALTYARIRKIAGNDFRRAERQRRVVSLLFEKAKSGGILGINSLMDTIFPEVSTSLDFGECLDLAINIMNYTLGDSHGFPFDMRTADLGKKGDVVVPCTLLDNVTKAHAFLYDVEGYVPTNAVTQISNKIQADSGFDSSYAVDYGY